MTEPKQPATYGRLADDIEAEIAGCRWCNQSPDSAHSVSMKHDDWMDVVKGLRSAESETATHTDHPSRHWDRTCPACVNNAGPQAGACPGAGSIPVGRAPTASVSAELERTWIHPDAIEGFRAEFLEREQNIPRLRQLNALCDQAIRCYRERSLPSATAATTWAEEAAEDIESWASYASAYFQEKHDLAGTLKKWRDRANGNSSTYTARNAHELHARTVASNK